METEILCTNFRKIISVGGISFAVLDSVNINVNCALFYPHRGEHSLGSGIWFGLIFVCFSSCLLEAKLIFIGSDKN